MNVEFTINPTTITSVIMAGIAVMTYIRTVKTHIKQVRENDLQHIDAKLDVMTKRIDDIYKMLAEKR